MPIIKSAKKKARQDVKRRSRNFLVRTALRKAVRAFNDAAKSGTKAEAEKLLSPAYKVIDTATKKKILEKNTAARRKSLLAKRLADMKA